MQEETVQWDPLAINRNPSWVIRFFVLYLLTVLVISLVKSISLAAQLWRFERKFPQEVASEAERANRFAVSAISKRFSLETVNGALGHLRVLHQANNKFQYLWEMCSAKTKSIESLGRLTLFLSILLLVHGVINILDEVMRVKRIWIGAVSGGLSECFGPFGLGILVCAVLYSVFSLFEGALARRRARWNYFYATANSDAPAE